MRPNLATKVRVLLSAWIFCSVMSEAENITTTVPTSAPTFHNLQTGYWKIDESAFTPLRCPYGDTSCLGGTVGGVESCEPLFTGIQCAQAVDGNYIDWTFRDSMSCDKKMVGLALFLTMIIAVVLPVYICCCVGVKRKPSKDSQDGTTTTDSSAGSTTSKKRTSPSRSLIGGGDDKDDASFFSFNTFTNPSQIIATKMEAITIPEGNTNKAMNFLIKLKILIFAMQITSSLPNSLLIPLPQAASHILRIYSYLSWASLQALPLKCMTHMLNVNINYQNSMELATVVPLLALIVFSIAYFSHVELLYLVKNTKQYKLLQKQVSIRYGTLLFMFVYVIQGGVHNLVFGSFECVDADPDGVVDGEQIVLRNDVGVSCHGTAYNYGYMWGIIAVILYAVAIPCIQTLVLWLYQKSVAQDLKVQLQVENGTYTSTKGDTLASHADDASIHSGDYSLVIPSETPSRSVLNQQQRDRLNSSGSGSGWSTTPRSRVSRDVESQQRHAKERKRPRNKLARYYDAVAILHLAYKAQHKYWELFDHLIRVFYMAVLPLLSSNNTNAQIVIALAATMFILMRLINANPYVNGDNQALAVLAMVQIAVVLLCVLTIQTDAYGDYTDGTVIFDAIMCIAVLSTPLLMVYQCAGGTMFCWTAVTIQPIVAKSSGTVARRRTSASSKNSSGKHSHTPRTVHSSGGSRHSASNRSVRSHSSASASVQMSPHAQQHRMSPLGSSYPRPSVPYSMQMQHHMGGQPFGQYQQQQQQDGRFAFPNITIPPGMAQQGYSGSQTPSSHFLPPPLMQHSSPPMYSSGSSVTPTEPFVSYEHTRQFHSEQQLQHELRVRQQPPFELRVHIPNQSPLGYHSPEEHKVSPDHYSYARRPQQQQHEVRSTPSPHSAPLGHHSGHSGSSHTEQQQHQQHQQHQQDQQQEHGVSTSATTALFNSPSSTTSAGVYYDAVYSNNSGESSMERDGYFTNPYRRSQGSSSVERHSDSSALTGDTEDQTADSQLHMTPPSPTSTPPDSPRQSLEHAADTQQQSQKCAPQTPGRTKSPSETVKAKTQLESVEKVSNVLSSGLFGRSLRFPRLMLSSSTAAAAERSEKTGDDNFHEWDSVCTDNQRSPSSSQTNNSKKQHRRQGGVRRKPRLNRHQQQQQQNENPADCFDELFNECLDTEALNNDNDSDDDIDDDDEIVDNSFDHTLSSLTNTLAVINPPSPTSTAPPSPVEPAGIDTVNVHVISKFNEETGRVERYRCDSREYDACIAGGDAPVDDTNSGSTRPEGFTLQTRYDSEMNSAKLYFEQQQKETEGSSEKNLESPSKKDKKVKSSWLGKVLHRGVNMADGALVGNKKDEDERGEGGREISPLGKGLHKAVNIADSAAMAYLPLNVI